MKRKWRVAGVLAVVFLMSACGERNKETSSTPSKKSAVSQQIESKVSAAMQEAKREAREALEHLKVTERKSPGDIEKNAAPLQPDAAKKDH